MNKLRAMPQRYFTLQCTEGAGDKNNMKSFSNYYVAEIKVDRIGGAMREREIEIIHRMRG